MRQQGAELSSRLIDIDNSEGRDTMHDCERERYFAHRAVVGGVFNDPTSLRVVYEIPNAVPLISARYHCDLSAVHASRLVALLSVLVVLLMQALQHH